MFTFDEFWGSLGISISGNSSSAANNTRSRLSLSTIYIYTISIYIVDNDLISQNQSGLKPRDLSINQLISISLKIYQYFDNVREVRGVFTRQIP